MAWSRGYAAAETRSAFDRVEELASRAETVERYTAYYGRWVASYVRGELRLARQMSEAFLHEAESEGRPMEAGVARRTLGMSCFHLGEFAKARGRLERTIADYDPERDREARFRFGVDTKLAAATYLAAAIWLLGEVERADQLFDQALRQAAEIEHVPTLINVYPYKLIIECLRGDAAAAARSAEAIVGLCRQHEIPLYQRLGEICSGWARGRLSEPEAGVIELRAALTAYVGLGNALATPFFRGLLAELEAVTQGPDSALAELDEALILAERTGEHASDAFLHRLRGQILLNRDPPALVAAEKAFRTAIEIAEAQEARSLRLQAALSLAKLCQASNRPAQACGVLRPALEGFSPTPAMPEIAEALAVLEQVEGG
jgi:predicted ATPase